MTSNSIQDGGALVVNILVFDLHVQLQHCTYQRKTLPFAHLIKGSTVICKREILGCSSPLTSLLKHAIPLLPSVAKLSMATGHAMQIYNCLGKLRQL